jgi:hypothetical protein
VRARNIKQSISTAFPDQGLILPNAQAVGHDSCRIQIMRDGTVGKNDATYIFAYLPILKFVDINTSVIPSSNLRAWWYDPCSDGSLPIAFFKNHGDFSPKGDQLPQASEGGPDWVLVIDDASKGNSAPGHKLHN